jgi:uncharacterized protein
VPYPYHTEQRALQDHFDTRRLADALSERNVRDHLDDGDREFVERLDMFFLATVDADGMPECSFKAGDPGFVRIVSPGEIAFPNWDGNGMYVSLGNIAANPAVGLLFIDFEQQKRLRMCGVAAIDPDDPLIGEWPEAQLVVRVALTRVYPNCPRYIPKMQLVERSRFTPRRGVETPVPAWKERYRDVLPARDRL